MAAGIGEAVVSSVASQVAESAFDVIRLHISYVFKYKSYIHDLKKQVDPDLKNKRRRVEVEVEKAERQGEEIHEDVKQWLIDLSKFTEEVANPIIEDASKNRCFEGFCPNLIKRYTLSKKAEQAVKDGYNLMGKGNFSSVSFYPVRLRTSSMYDRGYEGFDSRESNLQDIMEALKDTDSTIIGVWGMGGVGKTTLVKRVAGKVMEDKLFDTVVMAEITQTIDIKQIQDKIAYDLGLQLGQQSVFERAGHIRDRLKKEKTVLIILDNLWGKVDLEAIGIFVWDFEKESSNQKEEREEIENIQQEEREKLNGSGRRCKILLTSREQNVLRQDMKTHKNINVSPLLTEEALNWFWKVAGDSAEEPDFRHTAVEIVEKCAGLPLAITTIATSLKNKGLPAWKDASNQLRRCNLGTSDMGPVQSIIQLSYDAQKNEAKLLFQLCGLFNAGHSIHIDELLGYGIGLELLKNYNTLDEGRNRLYNLIYDLKASCLLLDGDVYQTFKMHDIIHAVAVSMASTEHMFNLQGVSDLKDKLEDGNYEESTAISLPSTDTSELPEKLKCPKLKLFSWFAKESSPEIPNAFFEGTEELKIIDLSCVCFPLQSSSLCHLANLQTLRLNNCQLGDSIRTIGELRKLEILSFWGSDIKLLPAEIGQLTRLKLLNLGNCSQLEVITPNVISSLSRLEELYLNNSFTKWEVDGLNKSNASLTELKQLSRMTTLIIHIPDAEIMPQDLFSREKLERFRILIGNVWSWSEERILMGDVWSWSEKYESYRMLKLKINSDIYLGNGIRTLLTKTEVLFLDELSGVRNFPYELDEEGFPNLKHLLVQNDPNLLYIVSSMGAFPKLESLLLCNLIKLERICDGPLSKGSFSKLKLLEVYECGSLRYIFTPPIVMGLEQLQKMTIKGCGMLEEIIAKEGEKDLAAIDQIKFRLLDTIILKDLSNLKSFCSGCNILKFPSLKSITMDNCPKMETFVHNDMKDLSRHPAPLFCDKVEIHSLEKLEIFQMSNLRKLWPNKLSLGKLKELMVWRCNKLVNIFSSDMIGGLQRLNALRVGYCSSLEEIVSCMEEEAVAKKEVPTLVFPHLTSLELSGGLPNLKNFYPKKHVTKWPKLERLTVDGCGEVHIFLGLQDSRGESLNEIPIQQPLFSIDEVGFLSLKKLKISSMKELRKIWPNKLSFGKLKELEVCHCYKLVNIFSSDMIGGLQRLNALTVGYCHSLKEIVSCTEEETVAKEEVPTLVFPHLTSLELLRLRKLKKFYPKKHITKWPTLEQLTVLGCDKVQIFMGLQGAREESLNEIPIQQPLFCIDEVGFLSLKKLRIEEMAELRKIWPNKLSLGKLKELEVWSCNKLVNIFSSDMIGGLQGLNALSVRDCESLEEIVSCMEEETVAKEEVPTFVFLHLTLLELSDLPNLKKLYPKKHITKWPKLKKLKLNYCSKVEILASELPSFEDIDGESRHEIPIQQPLFSIDKDPFPRLEELELSRQPKLFHLIWKKHSQPSKAFQNLRTLRVSHCDNLENLEPFMVHFQNLTTLEVGHCCKLIYLMTLSTVKSLVQLTSMEIRCCEMIKEFIAHTGDEEKDWKIFRQLKSLKLFNLPRLTSFCQGNHTIEFSSLERRIVGKCMNFSLEALRAPKLRQLTEDIGCIDCRKERLLEEIQRLEEEAIQALLANSRRQH